MVASSRPAFPRRFRAPGKHFVALVLFAVGCEQVWGFEEAERKASDSESGAAGMDSSDRSQAPTNGGSSGSGGGSLGGGAARGGDAARSGATGVGGNVATGGMGVGGNVAMGGTSNGGATSVRGGETGAAGGDGAAGEAGTGAAGEGVGGVGGVGAGGVGGGGGAGAESGSGSEVCRTSDECPNPDPECDVRCDRTGPEARCVVFARDADHDLHGSKACAAAPGDDCDDSRASVYPLADEVCDGLDNDCDGKSDLEEGHLHLSGSRDVLPNSRYADVAWSSADQAYGLVWGAGRGGAPYFVSLTAKGNMAIEPVPLDSPEESSNSAGVSIAAGDKQFGVVWSSGQVYYRTINADGTPGLPMTRLNDDWGDWGTDNPALTWTGAGAWAAFWWDSRDNGSAVFGRLIFPIGEPSEELLVADGGVYPSAAALDGKIAVVWSGLDANSSLRTAALGVVGALAIDQSTDPVVASNALEFGAAWRSTDKLAFTALDTDGKEICSARTEAEGFIPKDIVPAGDGFVIFSGSPSVQALEVLKGCRFGRRIEIDERPGSVVRAASAEGKGFTVVWAEANDSVRRTFGPHFCD